MEHADEIAERTAAWAAELSREEVYHRCQAEGTPAAPVRDVAEVLAWEQPRARGFFRALDHPEAGRRAASRAASTSRRSSTT
jgi:crotonobetainyl-CoA:carnitine CoA-transferase CaiB-like acyl-CoA transferase